jgi:hypothetical protein
LWGVCWCVDFGHESWTACDFVRGDDNCLPKVEWLGGDAVRWLSLQNRTLTRSAWVIVTLFRSGRALLLIAPRQQWKFENIP